MADFVAPAGWKLFSKEKDSTTFILPGHTVKASRLAIFARVTPVSSGKGSTVPSCRIRFLEASVNTDGTVSPTKMSVDTTVRYPIEADPVKVTALLALAGAALSNVDLQQDLVVEQLLPTAVA